MQVRVECCGAASRFAAQPLAVELPEGATMLQLVDVLSSRSAEFAQLLTRCAFARGDRIVPRSTPLAEGDELAVLPPVAGG